MASATVLNSTNLRDYSNPLVLQGPRKGQSLPKNHRGSHNQNLGLLIPN